MERNHMFNEFQRTAISHLYHRKYVGLNTMEEVEKTGNALLIFLMRELSDDDEYDSCNSEFEAERRIEIAMGQLQDVYNALGQGNIHED